MASFVRLLASPADTAAAGEALGRCLERGDVIGLIGDLGAGKTHLVQGLAVGLGLDPAVPVTSPTFTLLNEYRGGRLVLHHADLYRIERARELDEIGFDDVIGGAGVLAVEWSDRFALLPGDHLRLVLEVTGPSERRLSAESGGPRSAVVLAAWAAALPTG
jgi:tRNA threonylcarbamoyladenosine biosynthesis protein TsaE